MTYAEAERYLKELSQTQILRFWDELNEEERKNLLKQIESTDFSVIDNFYHHEKLDGAGRTEPIQGLRLADIEKRREEFVAVGKAAIRAGKSVRCFLRADRVPVWVSTDPRVLLTSASPHRCISLSNR